MLPSPLEREGIISRNNERAPSRRWAVSVVTVRDSGPCQIYMWRARDGCSRVQGCCSTFLKALTGLLSCSVCIPLSFILPPLLTFVSFPSSSSGSLVFQSLPKSGPLPLVVVRRRRAQQQNTMTPPPPCPPTAGRT